MTARDRNSGFAARPRDLPTPAMRRGPTQDRC